MVAGRGEVGGSAIFLFFYFVCMRKKNLGETDVVSRMAVRMLRGAVNAPGLPYALPYVYRAQDDSKKPDTLESGAFEELESSFQEVLHPEHCQLRLPFGLSCASLGTVTEPSRGLAGVP